VTFGLWDLDLGNFSSEGESFYQDLVSNIVSSTTATPTSITLLGADNQDGDTNVDAAVSGYSVFGIASVGNPQARGNENDALNSGDALVSFGTDIMTSFSFRYSSGDGSGSLTTPLLPTNTTLQRIALHDITFFTPVPEVSAVGGSIAVCVAAMLGSLLCRPRRMTPQRAHCASCAV
jgi:hypothetical protein